MAAENYTDFLKRKKHSTGDFGFNPVWMPESAFDFQEHIIEMKEKGVRLLACKKCSDMYGVSDDLKRLGIEVKYMGKPLTDYLRNDNYRVLTI